MNPEQTFLDEKGLKVTNARFLVSGQTYSIAGITSVRLIQIPRKNALAWFLIIVGLFFILVPTILGIMILLKQPPPCAVGLSTASGEVSAYFTSDRAFAERIVSALNDAIVARG
jgi:hypothetical protein